jgi:hypothetical protein
LPVKEDVPSSPPPVKAAGPIKRAPKKQPASFAEPAAAGEKPESAGGLTVDQSAKIWNSMGKGKIQIGQASAGKSPSAKMRKELKGMPQVNVNDLLLSGKIPNICLDGIDNDKDGPKDLADPDCQWLLESLMKSQLDLSQ